MTWSEKAQTRAAAMHYDVMTLDQIKALPVGDLFADDAVLFMWVIQAMLPEALELINAYGFTYKTVALYWFKLLPSLDAQPKLFMTAEEMKMGMGYHTRAEVEQCWIATRGKGYVRQDAGVRQSIFAPLREHSRKPEEAVRRVERLVGPDLPKVEVFARRRRAGWTVFGNQVDRFQE